MGTFFADVNGDRRADAIVINDLGVSVRRAPAYDTTSVDFSGVWVGDSYCGSRGTYFADVTGTNARRCRRARGAATATSSSKSVLESPLRSFERQATGTAATIRLGCFAA